MNFPLPAIFAFAAVTGLASASVVNIDFGSSLLTNIYVGQAAAPDPAGGATATWNPLVQVAGTASSVDLKDSTNANTGIGFSISGVGSTSNALTEAERSGGYVSLMRDYIQVDSANSSTIATATGTFTGLVVGGTYDIYFYGQGESMSTTTGAGGFRGLNSYFEVNGVGKQTGWDGVAGGNGLLVEGIEYVKYTVVIGAGGNLVFDFENVVPGGNVTTDLAPTATGGGARRGVLNAIQLVKVVPEPSTALLGMIGMLGLLVRRRR